MQRPPQCAEGYGYNANQEGVAAVGQSAKIVVPLLCQRFHPASVFDIGCGVGDWLKVFLDKGVTAVCGWDGPWVPRNGLQIPSDNFRSVDFYSDLPEPGRFDLSICLEVAEHVSPEIAHKILSLLCKSADLVLFSAAVPGQGGYKHINEHFQADWITQFQSLGYLPFDCVRPFIWMNDQVSWWYQQNCLVFANSAAQQKHGLRDLPFLTSVIHPALYEKVRDPANYSLKGILRYMPRYVERILNKCFG